MVLLEGRKNTKLFEERERDICKWPPQGQIHAEQLQETIRLGECKIYSPTDALFFNQHHIFREKSQIDIVFDLMSR